MERLGRHGGCCAVHRRQRHAILSLLGRTSTIKTLFLIPERDNLGQRFRGVRWQELDTQLAEAFGGFSRRSGVVGVWQSEGREYRDISREYTVALASLRQLPRWLAIADWTCRHFAQEALYVEVAGCPEILAPVD